MFDKGTIVMYEDETYDTPAIVTASDNQGVHLRFFGRTTTAIAQPDELTECDWILNKTGGWPSQHIQIIEDDEYSHHVKWMPEQDILLYSEHIEDGVTDFQINSDLWSLVDSAARELLLNLVS